jgi:hypothetical protein
MHIASRVILFIVCMGMSVSAVAISELELQKLEKFSFSPPLSTNTLDKVFIDLNVVHAPQIENTTPLSITEFRTQLKQHFAWQLNPKWQLGIDSFKSCPIDKQAINWPTSTEPKESRSASQKGYGVGIRMKLD